MATILITGAHGLIGNQLARRFSEDGWVVVGTSRRAQPIPYCDISCCRSFGTPLGRVFHDQTIDVVVHCAHDVSAAGAATSEQGTLQWAEEARQHGTSRQVFVSSISARPDALAAYGQVKHRLEDWFLQRGGSIVRLGLVIGNGGLFARIARLVQKLPIVPLIDGGRTRVYFNSLDFVREQIARIVLQWPGTVEWNLQQPEPTTMRTLLEAVRDVVGAKSWFVPVPYQPCLAMAWLLHQFGLNGPGISYENIVGLRQNDVPGMRSDFLSLGGRPQDVRTLVAAALARSGETAEVDPRCTAPPNSCR
jgi:nucleoside-diphosphate-sugar epimerase